MKPLFLSPCLFVLLNCFRSSWSSLSVQKDDFVGQVEAGNYSYFRLKADIDDSPSAALVLLLYSTEGDADLYVSHSIEKPTYDYGKHDFQSISCGLDRLDINLRPLQLNDVRSRGPHIVNIGVYGHPSHPISHFVLRVLLLTDDEIGWENDPDEQINSIINADVWREWVSQVDVSGEQSIDSFPLTGDTQFMDLVKSTTEIMLAVLSFLLNILVEVLL